MEENTSFVNLFTKSAFRASILFADI